MVWLKGWGFVNVKQWQNPFFMAESFCSDANLAKSL
jgi:hypothetical protein